MRIDRSMRHALGVLLTATASLAAAQPTAAPPAAPPAAAATSPVRDARALDALAATGAYLRTLKSFSMRADTTIDEVLQSGQKLQFGGTVEYRVVMPDRLRLEIRSDRQHRDLIYDGRTLTMVAPRLKYYATVPAPRTIAELVRVADRDHGIALPIADLFLWGGPDDGRADITEAAYIGPARIAGTACDHYAFRQEGVDWQLWIRTGAQPLPCRLVITTLDEPEQPQFAATFRWDLAAKPQASNFAYRPPAGASRIVMTRTDAAPSGR